MFAMWKATCFVSKRENFFLRCDDFLHRIAMREARVEPRGPHEEPDVTVTAIAQIPDAVASLDG